MNPARNQAVENPRSQLEKLYWKINNIVNSEYNILA